jgi:hypothetical protein
VCYNEKRLRIDVLWAFAWRMFFYKKMWRKSEKGGKRWAEKKKTYW